MDEYMLNDLLECSVCLERLDTSSRVLPCQHTFCKKCLEEIFSTKKELRCPECRVLVTIKIEDLPPNVLLMRILGGMRNAQPKNRTVVPNRMPQPNVLTAPTVLQPTVLHHATAPDITRVNYTPKQALSPNQPYARAVYDYLSNEPGDLKFKKGDIILLRKKMDANWYHGESGGNHGVFPLTYVQVVTPLPSHIPQCKALYDFRMTNDDEEGCLTFNKGEVITVIRRVDENWAEGKLVDRIGIFPLAFVELNNVARALMKLSSNSQPGPSRLAPPTPTSEDMTPLIPTDHTRTVATSQVPPHRPSCPQSTPASQANSAATPHHHITMGGGAASDSSSTVSSASSSTTTPNTSSSNTSSSSSTAPSSPASPPPPRPAPCQSVSSPPPRPAAHNPSMSPPHVAQSQQSRGKRHSFSTGILHTGHPHQTSHRHSAEILAPSELSSDAATGEQTSQAQPPGEPPLQRQGSQRHRRSTSADTTTGAPPPPPPQGVSGSSVAHLPAAYVALYPYRPQKADEVELKKGGVYMVTERCQDGWFKGTSHRTQKGGVFPGNYVAPAKSVSGSMQAQLRGLARPSSSPGAANQAASSPRTNGTSSLEPASTVSYTRIGTKQSARPAAVSSQPPELPPRATSPHVAAPQQPPGSSISTSWHGPPGGQDGGQPGPLGRSQSAAVMSANTSPGVVAAVMAPPNVTVASPRPPEKQAKERKEKSGVSLMRRLTNIKKSKSPPPLSSYSMDNPVFEDGLSAAASPVHPVHVRSGSCPSQLLQVVPLDGSTVHHRRLFGTGSQRIKQKSDRPNVVIANVPPHFGRLPAEASSTANCGTSADASQHFLAQHNSTLGAHQHRKSNSLDAGEAGRKPAKPVAPPVRERFRCIVPYPPNSDYELELRVGDIIYVHKKRDDGWYKGTQQRTGRTGLFPASFVETF